MLTATLIAVLAAAGCAGSDTPGTGVIGPEPTVASVSITPPTLSLAPGATTRLAADARQANGASLPGAPVSWSTSSSSVATVATDGTVTAVAGGTATITASAGGRSASATVNVERTYDLDALGVPKLIANDYIDLDKIARISRFRSGVGHDYSDDAERCRSMKHYFQPRSGLDWGTVAISSPLAGTVAEVQDETTFGKQLRITSSANPALTVIIFHVRPEAGVVAGAAVAAGQPLGSHVGSQTMSDIAIRVQTPGGSRFVSYFDALTDVLFERYASHGVTSRQAMVISAAERDASPLACVGEQFQDAGALPNWVELR